MNPSPILGAWGFSSLQELLQAGWAAEVQSAKCRPSPGPGREDGIKPGPRTSWPRHGDEISDLSARQQANHRMRTTTVQQMVLVLPLGTTPVCSRYSRRDKLSGQHCTVCLMAYP